MLAKTIETVLINLFVTNKHHDKSWCWLKNWANTI